MAILSKPSPAARLALIYITVGALTDVWSGIWYWRLSQGLPENAESLSWYICYGFLLSGLVLLLIGLGVGRIGRAARHAELPPQEVTRAVVDAEQNAASQARVVVPQPDGVVTPPVATTQPAPVQAVPENPVIIPGRR